MVKTIKFEANVGDTLYCPHCNSELFAYEKPDTIDSSCGCLIGDFSCQGSGLNNPHPRILLGDAKIFYDNFRKSLSTELDPDFTEYAESHNYEIETTIIYIVGPDDWGLGCKILQPKQVL